MKKSSESGYITAPVLLVIFILTILVCSATLLIYSQTKKVESLKFQFEQKKEAYDLLNHILNDFQVLTKEKMDNEFSEFIIQLKNKYGKNNFSMEDCSTGLNLEMVSKKILENQEIKYLLDVYGDEIITDYGWININLADISYINSLKKEFETENLYPLVNNMAPFNIFKMNQDFIKSILLLNNVEDAERKSEELYAKCKSNSLKENDLPANNKLIGTKTSFWKICFETDYYKILSVFAAVPNKNSTSIAKYKIVETDFKYKGNMNEKVQ